jgi:hypothetical protein
VPESTTATARRLVHDRDGLEEDVRGGAQEVHGQGPRQRDRPALADQQVVVGRGHEDPARLQTITVFGLLHVEIRPSREDLGHQALVVRMDVLHHEDRGREVVREIREDAAERLEPAGGCGHDDDLRSDAPLSRAASPRFS